MPTVVGYKTVRAIEVPIGCMFRAIDTNGDEDGLFLRIVKQPEQDEMSALIVEPLTKYIGAVSPSMEVTDWDGDELVLLITEWEVV